MLPTRLQSIQVKEAATAEILNNQAQKEIITMTVLTRWELSVSFLPYRTA